MVVDHRIQVGLGFCTTSTCFLDKSYMDFTDAGAYASVNSLLWTWLGQLLGLFIMNPGAGPTRTLLPGAGSGRNL